MMIIILRPGFDEVQTHGVRYHDVHPLVMAQLQAECRELWKQGEANVQFVQTGIAYEVKEVN